MLRQVAAWLGKQPKLSLQKGILNVDSGKPQAKGSTRQHVVSKSMHDPDVFGTMPAVRQCSVLTLDNS